MQVGVGLPSTLEGANRDLILNWARKADEGKFSTLGVFDRVLYHSFDSLATLAAVAAVTQRIRLATTVLIAPLRNTVLLAKETATIDQLSGGRLTLGVSIGARRDDYEITEVDQSTRGQKLDEMLAELRSHWEEGKIGPKPVQPN